MAVEQHNVIGIVDRMTEIANEHYNGNVVDNIYSIYMRLNDMERLQFMKFAYKASTAILTIVDVREGFCVTCNARDSDQQQQAPKRKKSLEEISDSDLEIVDKRELVRMKHNALIATGKVVLLGFGVLVTGVILLSFISPGALRLLGNIGSILEVVVGG